MSFGKCITQDAININDILTKKSEVDILNFYLGISTLPILINSPLREDNNSSLGIFLGRNNNIIFYDFGTNESYNLWSFLSTLWSLNYNETLAKISREINKISKSKLNVLIRHSKHSSLLKEITLQVRIREWKNHDIDYWESYGISLKWLKYAEIYPISHTFITKNNNTYTFVADKYAYVYVEHKDNKTTYKIYQPFNTKGFKWTNNHNKSVIGLWNKIPKTGKHLCICSSVKDALCLWANTGIPSLTLQGEGYSMSKSAINNLKSRYTNIYIILDNDKAGLLNGEKLAKETGFINKILPNINNKKDISDLYQYLNNKQQFKQLIYQLLNLKNYGN